MNHRQLLNGTLLSVSLLFAAAPAFAQPLTRAEIEEQVDRGLIEGWNKALAEAARERSVPLNGNNRVLGTPEQIRQVFDAALTKLEADTSLVELFTPAYVQALIDEQVESRMPTSSNASSTNPAGGGLTERSGATSLAALAADISSLIAADTSAVSINLNALALVTISDPDVYSSLRNYQRHDLARRFSGTVVIGAKIPEKKITGLSNLPDFDKLLDAFSWDVKVRVWGDKDPRSSRWSPLTVRAGGFLTQKTAVLLSDVGSVRKTGSAEQLKDEEERAVAEAVILQPLLTTRLGLDLAGMKGRIARSPQLSVKAAGTHLTKEAGRNKYSVVALFDVGIGPSDLTANAQYSVTDDIRFGADKLFQTKIWTVSSELTSHLAPDAITQGRTIDWSVGAGADIFADSESLPVPVSNTWKLFTKLEFPIRGGGKIPVSVIYSNDPNALSKEKHVSGLVGVSYDFSALKELFTPR